MHLMFLYMKLLTIEGKIRKMMMLVSCFWHLWINSQRIGIIHDKIKQLLVSQNTVKDNSELHDKSDLFQMCMKNLKVSKHAVEADLLSRSYSAQVLENQTKTSL